MRDNESAEDSKESVYPASDEPSAPGFIANENFGSLFALIHIR